MKSRIIVVGDNLNADSQNAITNLFQSMGVAYWHWFPTLWLIVDNQGRDVRWWSQELVSVKGSSQFLAFDADGGAWNGFTDKQQYEWMYAFWRP